MNLIKKSFTLEGHKTSIALEPEFWAALAKLAEMADSSLPKLISSIDENRGERPLASAIRVHCLTAKIK